MKKSFNLQDKIEELEQIELYFKNTEINLDEGIKKHKQAILIGGEIEDYLLQVENELVEINK